MAMKPKAHAEMLAERIRTYWKVRGAEPVVEVVFETVQLPSTTAEADRRDGVWVVKSDMRGGMPRGFDLRMFRVPIR